MPLLGIFFTITLFLYVVINKSCHSDDNIRNILFVICAAILFVVFLLALFVVEEKNHKAFSEENTYGRSQNCMNCIKTLMPIHQHGLLYLDELLEFEKELNSNSKVLIYTSDLTSELNVVENVVKPNINRGVQYLIFYFTNKCSEKIYNMIKKEYGKNNLVDLSKNEEFKNSFDGRLADTLGFDLIIYKFNENEIRGYFAVDYVPFNEEGRLCPDPTCEECNRKKKDFRPFYKKLSPAIAKHLFEEGINIHKKMAKNEC